MTLADVVDLDALGTAGPYRTRVRDEITDTAGSLVARMSVAPPLYLARTITAQRRARPLPPAERKAALIAAAHDFRTATLGGLDFDRYVELTCRVSGLPLTVARAGGLAVAEDLTTATQSVDAARPEGARADVREFAAGEGGAAWVRRGDVLAVLAPGNAPGVHGLWPQALLLGHRVAVRPSRREPFTAHRLVLALQRNGFRPTDVTCLPTDHAGADELVRSADLALVYGGQDVADHYAQDPTVFVNGPGRSKILVTADTDWHPYLDTIIDSVTRHAGMACVNATAVLVEGDPAPLAHAVADRLRHLPVHPHTDERAVLPTMPVDAARKLARHLARAAVGSTAVLGADQVVVDLGDGHAALRPAVHLIPAARPDTLDVELPFPCVWIAAWDRRDGLAPLRHSLVVTALTRDEDLVGDLLDEASITNVYWGDHPTHTVAPHIPHDGFLADFLMRTKGFLRD